MEAISKIKDEQLAKLQEFRNFFTNSNMVLGEATLSYEFAKKDILAKVEERDAEFQAFRKELEKEYGKVNINVSNGEYEVLPEPETKQE